MPFWWVNHKQTFKAEIDGEYIWSPQANNNGSRNQTYINLTKTQVGDIVFSYASGKIQAVGKVMARAKSEERPAEFGSTGHQWDKKGWLVPIFWDRLSDPLVPKDHLMEIIPLLPDKHAPIQANGNGNQAVYLAAIGDQLGRRLLSLIDRANFSFTNELEDLFITRLEDDAAKEIAQSKGPNTQKQQLILARIGQGLFRQNVGKIESHCRITGLDDKRLLVASHIKPWKDSTNVERLDGHNGFLLSPHIDRLFDKGWISFEDNGSILISKHQIVSVLELWHIDSNQTVGTFTSKQKGFLDYHRSKIFKG